MFLPKSLCVGSLFPLSPPLQPQLLFNQISLKINDCVNLLKKQIDINNLKNLYQYLEEDKKIKVDYLEVRDDDELLLTQKNKNARLFISFYIEDIRIIDNFKLY